MIQLSTMGKRSYKQNCALAQAADVIGERWTLLLVRDLLVDPRRFKDLLQSLKGIGTNLLATRLRDMESAGLIERTGGDNGTSAYALTASGAALEPAVLALVRWGLVHGPKNQPGYHHLEDWDLVALKALFQPQRAGDLRLTVQFRSETLIGWIELNDGVATIGLGQRETSDLTIDGTIAELFTGQGAPAELLAVGDPETLGQFMSTFALRA